VFDPRARNLLSFAYKSIMRLATSVFITIDPIGIIKNYVQTLKDNLAKIDKQIANVKGQIVMLKNQIAENQRQIKQNFQTAQSAGDDSRFALNKKLAMRSAGRLNDSTKTLQDMEVKLEGLYRILNKTYEAADFLIKDIDDDVKVKERERAAILASHSAIRSAMKIIKPEDDKKAMFDAALEFMAEDIGSKVGDIEHFMEISEGFMNGVDLQNGVFEQQGWELLEQWEKQDSPLLKESKPQLLARAADPKDTLDLDNSFDKEGIPHFNQFDSLFNK
jgi:predicted  nucleic acid-binding Zn-ribbon protein